MNAEIFQAYQKLSDAEKKMLLAKIADSERLVQIVHFIEKKKGVFQNHEIIADVFKVPFNDNEFPKARNNYFKLRKKLLEIIHDLEMVDENILPAEKEIIDCRKLIGEQQYAAAKRKLTTLRNELWQNNIFEHLCDCIYQLMTVEQCLDSGYSSEFTTLMKEYDLACDLKRDLQKQLYYYTSRYHEDMEPQFEKKMAHIAEKNKNYPRFKIIYLYTKVLAGITDATPKRTALGNFEKLEKILEQHQEIPVFHYTTNSFIKIKGFWLPMIKMHYAILHRDFHEGFELMKQYKATLKNNTKLFGGQQNENLFKNEIRACIYASKYKEALLIVEELKEFQTLNGKKENHLNNYIEIANIYSFSFPSLKTNHVNGILSFLDNIMKQEKKNNIDIYKDAHFASFLLLYTYGFKSKAKKYFDAKECKEEIKRLQIPELSLLFEENKNSKEVLKTKIKENSSLMQETYYKWALNMLGQKQ